MKNLWAVLFISIPVLSKAASIVPGLTAVYEHQRQVVKLKWNHNDKRVFSYILQRSADNNSWTAIQQVSITNSQQYQFITYADKKVAAGKNYYRLKMLLANAAVEFTASIMVIIGQPGNNWLIYPVPVKDILNLQYNGNALIPGVIVVFIQNINGRMFHKLRYASSTRQIQIPVANLGRGTYDIRIVINDEVVWNQRFVK